MLYNIMTRKQLEKILKVPIRENVTVIGLDTASRTGWCVIDTSKPKLKITYGFIDINSKNKLIKLNAFIRVFKDLIKEGQEVIVEDTFLKYYFWGGKQRANVAGFALLCRIGAVAYTIAKLKQCPARFINASSARKKLKLKKSKKAEVQAEFKEKFGFEDIEDNDICDALILALNGIIK